MAPRRKPDVRLWLRIWVDPDGPSTPKEGICEPKEGIFAAAIAGVKYAWGFGDGA